MHQKVFLEIRIVSRVWIAARDNSLYSCPLSEVGKDNVRIYKKQKDLWFIVKV